MVMGGSGWPSLADRNAENSPVAQHAQSRVGLFWAFIGPLVGVLVVAHGGGGVRECQGEQMVVIGGQKMLGKASRIQVQHRGGPVHSRSLGRVWVHF